MEKAMNIVEAVRSAPKGSKIARKKDISVVIKPTNTIGGCIVSYNGKKYATWEPNREDLTADDWITIGDNKRFTGESDNQIKGITVELENFQAHPDSFIQHDHIQAQNRMNSLSKGLAIALLIILVLGCVGAIVDCFL